MKHPQEPTKRIEGNNRIHMKKALRFEVYEAITQKGSKRRREAFWKNQKGRGRCSTNALFQAIWAKKICLVLMGMCCFFWY